MHGEPNNPICGPPAAKTTSDSPHRLPFNPKTIYIPPFAAALLVAAAARGDAARADWVEFVDETATRLVAAPGVGAGDTEEKSYSWGDVDRDGDDDLVVARKQPFSSPGKRRNVLLLNEGGVLVDRTADFAASSDVPGDSGFLTPTSGRDILLVDVDLDGWPDVVTATAWSASDPKHIAYPRIYHNLGEDRDGWRGLRHEDARIPAMLSYGGQSGFNPSFAAVAAGDVNGDGYPDLYFSDHDVGAEPPGSDFNDKLLLNHGAANPGFFTDVTADAFEDLVMLPGPDQPFPVSSYSTSAAIADMNGDGAMDIVKDTAYSSPIYVGIAYNDPASQGAFDTYGVIYQNAPYYVSTGDLNNDDRLDVVITDEGVDRYLLNQGNGADSLANFSPFMFSFFHDGDGAPGSDQGFGGDSRIADLDNDGWNDVLVTDVHVELPGCNRRLNVYRNLGGTPGGSVVLQEQTSGEGCQVVMGNPPTCSVAGVPASQLEGVHDVAVFDIDGDGFQDLVLGRCTGTAVYINAPPVPAGAVPDGNAVAGAPLTVERRPLGRVKLTWDPSCTPADTDYAIYEGVIGDFTSHAQETCSTGGATTFTFRAGDAAYFLVVPENADREGSYGLDGDGAERPPAAEACLPQHRGVCE